MKEHYKLHLRSQNYPEAKTRQQSNKKENYRLFFIISTDAKFSNKILSS